MKILFYDIWRAGLSFTDDVAEILKQQGHESYFIHSEQSQYPFIDQILIDSCKKTYQSRIDKNNLYTGIIDISKQYNSSVIKLLDDIQPDVFVVIALDGAFQRFGSYIARLKGVKTLAYMHGVILPTAPIPKSKLLGKVKRAFSYGLQFHHHYKDLRQLSKKTLLWYIKNLYALVVKYSQFRDCILGDEFLTYDVICTFSDVYSKEVFNKNELAFKNTQFVAVGFNDFNKIINEYKQQKVITETSNQSRVTYISQPLTIVGCSRQTVIKAILNIKKVVEESNAIFVFRSHPRDDGLLLNELKNYNISFSNQSLTECLLTSAAVVGVNSTLLPLFDYFGITVINIEFPPYAEHLEYFDISVSPSLIIDQANIIDRGIEIEELLKMKTIKTVKDDIEKLNPPAFYISQQILNLANDAQK